MVYSTDRSKAVFPVLVLLFVTLWFILRGDLFYVLPCVILFLCFQSLYHYDYLARGKRELILVLFVRLFDLCLFGFVGFLFLLVSGKGCSLWLWHSLDFSLTFFICQCLILSLLYLVSSEGCATRLWYFLGSFTYSCEHAYKFKTYPLVYHYVDPCENVSSMHMRTAKAQISLRISLYCPPAKLCDTYRISCKC